MSVPRRRSPPPAPAPTPATPGTPGKPGTPGAVAGALGAVLGVEQQALATYRDVLAALGPIAPLANMPAFLRGA